MTNATVKALNQLRFIGITEGISYVFLLVIAMPLKYMFDYPIVVKYTGWVHGILFVLYIAAVFKATFMAKWSLYRTFKYLVASLIPLATFFLDKELKHEADSIERRNLSGNAVSLDDIKV